MSTTFLAGRLGHGQDVGRRHRPPPAVGEVRSAEGGNGVTVEPLIPRQTKEAENRSVQPKATAHFPTLRLYRDGGVDAPRGRERARLSSVLVPDLEPVGAWLQLACRGPAAILDLLDRAVKQGLAPLDLDHEDNLDPFAVLFEAPNERRQNVFLIAILDEDARLREFTIRRPWIAAALLVLDGHVVMQRAVAHPRAAAEHPRLLGDCGRRRAPKQEDRGRSQSALHLNLPTSRLEPGSRDTPRFH